MVQTFVVFVDVPTTGENKNRECLNGRNDDVMSGFGIHMACTGWERPSKQQRQMEQQG